MRQPSPNQQNEILAQALISAQDPAKRRFDPAGYVIVEVPLTTEAGLTEITYCRLDVRRTAFQGEFQAWLCEGAVSRGAAEALLSSPSAASIIHLQHEMEMHVHLRWRVIQKFGDSIGIPSDNPRWPAIWENTAQKINQLVKARFQNALTAAYNQGNNAIDLNVLNEALDDAREELMETCKDALGDALIEHGISAEQLHALAPLLTRNDLEANTATGYDYFQTDSALHSATFIAATQNTAHNKQLNAATLADRAITHYAYDPQTLSVASIREKTEIRVPSIAMLSVNRINHDTAISDIVAKLEHLTSGGRDGEAFVYNLLTSLYRKGEDGGIDKNYQRESAARILKAVHVYNQQYRNRNKPIYIQNIPINGHGLDLAYHNYLGNASTRVEATLMAEMAMLHTLSIHPITSALTVIPFETAKRAYNGFLHDPHVDHQYFKDSPQGQELIAAMEDSYWSGPGFKTKLLNSLSADTKRGELPFAESAALALARILATNAHWNLENGTLTQTLSVFLQKNSIYGCKSANERFQMVANREELLLSIEQRQEADLKEEEKLLKRVIGAFAKGQTSVEALRTALDNAYALYNTQGSGAAVSVEDQGGPSKIKTYIQYVTNTSFFKQAKAFFTFREVNTNVAERVPTHSSGASPMQAHKDRNPSEFLERAAAKAPHQVTAASSP